MVCNRIEENAKTYESNLQTSFNSLKSTLLTANIKGFLNKIKKAKEICFRQPCSLCYIVLPMFFQLIKTP